MSVNNDNFNYYQNYGSGSIFDYIHHYYNNISQYYDNHINELHRKIGNLQKTIDYLSSVINSHNSELGQHRKKIRRIESQTKLDSGCNQIKTIFNLFGENLPNSDNMKATSSEPLIINTHHDSTTISESLVSKVSPILSNIDNINDIIKLQSIVSNDDLIELKKHHKFRILYDSIEPLIELNQMIGLDDIKKDIFRHICYFSNELNTDHDLMHVVVTGPPGVGKSEIGKIIGKLYTKLGFLSNGTFKSFKRSDLIAEYLGQTAIKTQKAIDSCIGGVMFIDEAYSLGNNELRDSFSKECLDTLNRNLTENGNKFLCIIAGYDEDITRCFFGYNKGLERRFNIRYHIKGYNSSELYQIFCKKLGKWKLLDPDYTKKLFDKNHDTCFKYFGGDVDTLLSKIKFEYAVRNIKEPLNSDYNLTNSDIDNGFEEFNKNRKHNLDVMLTMLYT